MTTSVRSFADFGVEESITRALADAGISVPFPIQELTLPLALSGADIIGQARTGTGKTLAFGIPLLSRVDPDLPVVQALVIVPTRELCLQVTGDLNQAGVQKGVDVAAIYGGRAIEPQVEAIRSGAGVVVGTPGRLLDLLRRGDLRLDRAATLVLDEADEMLDLGFLPDVEQLIEATAQDRQTLLFSATMPSQVVGLARRYMRKPTFLRADVEEVQIGPATTQYFFSCHRMDKPAVLARILQTPGRGLCVVFSRTKRMADILSEELRERGIAAAAIHSDLRQETREKTLARFRKGKVDVLVATEVAARGLDISDVTHVVNYDCPDDEKMYLHRIGRTGRAGAAGVAITLALWNEMARLEMIKRELGITDPTHEVFSTSPILDELFDLPPRTPRVPVVEVDEVDEDDDDDAVPAGEAAPRDEAAREDGTRRRRRRRGGRNRRPADSEAAAPAAAGEPAAPADADDDAVAAGADRPASRRTRQREDTRAQRRERVPDPAGAALPDDLDTAAAERAPGDRDTGDRTAEQVAGTPTAEDRADGSPRAGDRDAGTAADRDAQGRRPADGRGAGDRRSRSRTRTGGDRGRDAASDGRDRTAEAPAAPERPAAADRPAADRPAADRPAAAEDRGARAGDRGAAGTQDPQADAGEQGRGRRRRSPLLRSPLGLFSGWGGGRGRRDPAPEEAPRPEPDPAPEPEPVAAPDPAPAPVAEAGADPAPATEDGANGRTRIRRRTRGGEAERPAERNVRAAEEAVRAAEPRPARPAARRSGAGTARRDRDRDRSARNGRPARPAAPARAVIAPPDPETARGAGRPTRSRPMAIDHLP